ncbi:MAG: DMT family transporter [Streptosporangiales bacterium]
MLGPVLMIIAALLNATASVLQRRSAKAEPDSAAFSLHMFVDLARRPGWFLGIAAMISGFMLHAISISLSRIAFVQPLLVVELPFALVLASLTFRMRIPRKEWLAIGLQSAGLAAFVGCLAPTGGRPDKVPLTMWALAIGVTVAIVGVLVLLGYRGRNEHRAALLGVATGAAFGLNSSLIAGVGASVSHGASLFTTWQTYGVAVVGPASFFLLQNALSAGNLVASQPGFTLTNPLVSVAWGLVIFGEQPRTGAFLIGVFAGAALITAGTIVLSSSSLLDPNTTGGEDQSPDQPDRGEPPQQTERDPR